MLTEPLMRGPQVKNTDDNQFGEHESTLVYLPALSQQDSPGLSRRVELDFPPP